MIGNIGVFNNAVITYVKGNIDALNATLVCPNNAQLYNFGKINFREVTVGSGFTLTMNEFFNGTPSISCNIRIGRSNGSIGTNNFNVNFTDEFEKIGRFVQLSGATIANRNQLLVTNNSRFNTNRSTNIGVRYINQSPNGIPKGQPSINDTMTAPALGLVSDPNFVKQ